MIQTVAKYVDKLTTLFCIVVHRATHLDPDEIAQRADGSKIVHSRMDVEIVCWSESKRELENIITTLRKTGYMGERGFINGDIYAIREMSHVRYQTVDNYLQFAERLGSEWLHRAELIKQATEG